VYAGGVRRGVVGKAPTKLGSATNVENPFSAAIVLMQGRLMTGEFSNNIYNFAKYFL
jgi:hypothetical protein